MSQTPIWDELVAKAAAKITGPTELALVSQVEAERIAADQALTWEATVRQMIADADEGDRRVREMFRRIPDAEPRVIGEQPATVQFKRWVPPHVVAHVHHNGIHYAVWSDPDPEAPGWLLAPYPTPDVLGPVATHVDPNRHT